MRVTTLFGQFRTPFLARQLDDPVFGHLCRRHGIMWETKAALPEAGERLTVDVFAPEAGPSEAQRELFSHLGEHFRELKAEMEQPLHDKYQRICKMFRAQYAGKPYEPDFEHDFPPCHCPAAIWNIAHLDHLEFYGNPKLDLIFNHALNWENDHHLNVMIKNWHVVDLEMDGCDG